MIHQYMYDKLLISLNRDKSLIIITIIFSNIAPFLIPVCFSEVPGDIPTRVPGRQPQRVPCGCQHHAALCDFTVIRKGHYKATS